MPAAETACDRFDIRLAGSADDGGEGRELPMRILVLGACSGVARPAGRLGSRQPLAVSAETVAAVLAGVRPRLRLSVANALAGHGELQVEPVFAAFADFAPDALVRAVPGGLALLEVRAGLAALLAALGAGTAPATPTEQRGLACFRRASEAAGNAAAEPTRPALAALIADIDRRLSAQVDAILHHPAFRALEALWLGIARLARHAEGRSGVRVDLLDVTKDEMRDDFEDSSDIVASGLFKVVYSGEYGQHGGEPYALLVTDWAFSAGPQDLALLQRLSAVAAMAHAPLLASADPALLGLRDFARLEDLHALPELFAGPAYAKWRSFRASEDARYVGLVLPGIVLRTPWGEGASGAETFAYHEGGDGRLWGGGACALAARMAASFARWRWCAEAVGPGNGAIEDLPRQDFALARRIESRLPVEAWISEARAAGLAEEGLIAIATLRGDGECGFLAAPSCRAPATFARDAAGHAAALAERLGAQLPWLMLACRFAHCLKVMQRERIGGATSREDLERELNEWILRYVVDMDGADAATRQSSPLRAARLRVEDVPGSAGWYRLHLAITPHVRHLGSAFSLAVVGRLDRQAVA